MKLNESAWDDTSHMLLHDEKILQYEQGQLEPHNKDKEVNKLKI